MSFGGFFEETGGQNMIFEVIWGHSGSDIGVKRAFLRSFGIKNLSNLVLMFDVFSGCFVEWF